MPTYSYLREDGTVFELTQRMSDTALAVCPDTGQLVKRIITGGAGVVYKGEGWYVTDYKKRTGSPEVASSAPPEKPSVPNPASAAAE
jgi:putative FmdB family regulatory protein